MLALLGVLSLSAAADAGIAAGAPLHDAELVAYNEAATFDADSLERWNLYVTRLCIGVSGMWPDFESVDVKRRLLARLDRDRPGPRTRAIVLLWQHDPEASELLSTGQLAPASPIDDAILLTTVIYRHIGSASADPASEPAWERDLAALARNPVRLDRAFENEYRPSVGRPSPGESALHAVTALRAARELRPPGPGVTIGSTPAFWDALIAAAARRALTNGGSPTR